jgi:hypothetical protein
MDLIGGAQVITAAVLAYLTYLLWKSTSAYSKQVEIQTKLMDNELKHDIIRSKRDIITKEMDLLILPLMTVYHEIDSRGFESDWWILYIGPLATMTDPVTAAKFRDALKSIDQYKYLAPEDLRRSIEEFLLRLNGMKRRYVFSLPALRLAFGDCSVLSVPMLPVSS